mmetsp:Transcript_20193/g.69997  ORF Transcript_20193/g.69997 Transcript_20193/m.69997 type:complete len:219 (-) Transcript_20193:29-685(-)
MVHPADPDILAMVKEVHPSHGPEDQPSALRRWLPGDDEPHPGQIPGDMAQNIDVRAPLTTQPRNTRDHRIVRLLDGARPELVVVFGLTDQDAVAHRKAVVARDAVVRDGVLEKRLVESRCPHLGARRVPGESDAHRGVDAPPSPTDEEKWEFLQVRLRGVVDSGVQLTPKVERRKLIHVPLLGGDRERVDGRVGRLGDLRHGRCNSRARSFKQAAESG